MSEVAREDHLYSAGHVAYPAGTYHISVDVNGPKFGGPTEDATDRKRFKATQVIGPTLTTMTMYGSGSADTQELVSECQISVGQEFGKSWTTSTVLDGTKEVLEYAKP